MHGIYNCGQRLVPWHLVRELPATSLFADAERYASVRRHAHEARQRLEGEVRSLRRSLASRWRLCGLIGLTSPMQELFDRIERVAAADISVLVCGESGTGKELVARALHALGGRKSGPFVAINCAAVPGELLESEFFGHEQGAFSGAARRRLGLFEQANGGTLFLDEIGAMPIELQAKLLRVLAGR